jgi:cobalt-zinc-cadmium efflux system membrane fusion protein
MKTMPWLILIAILAAVPSHTGAQEHEHDHHPSKEPAGHEDHEEGGERRPILLTAEERAEFGIAVAEAGPGTIEVYLPLPGEVRPDADRLAHIVPRYSGIVMEVRANIGDAVTRSQVLAVVESDDALAPYDIKTLIAGTVIAKHITLGEAVSRERDAYVIADLGRVWVDLTVYQRDIDRIQVGQKALVYTGHGPEDASGTLSYITPVMDEETRTATARLVLPNPDGRWRPGMFVTARVLVERREAGVAVPRSAIQTVDERPVVFVETPEGFRLREVTVGTSGAEHLEIRDGLEPGERFVTAGSFTLKAELGKSSFGDGHGH